MPLDWKDRKKNYIYTLCFLIFLMMFFTLFNLFKRCNLYEEAVKTQTDLIITNYERINRDEECN